MIYGLNSAEAYELLKPLTLFVIGIVIYGTVPLSSYE